MRRSVSAVRLPTTRMRYRLSGVQTSRGLHGTNGIKQKPPATGPDACFQQESQEVSECFRQRLFKTLCEEFRLALLRQAGVGQDVLYLLVSRNHSCESQGLIPLINGVLVLRGFKNGLRVGSG